MRLPIARSFLSFLVSWPEFPLVFDLLSIFVLHWWQVGAPGSPPSPGEIPGPQWFEREPARRAACASLPVLRLRRVLPLAESGRYPREPVSAQASGPRAAGRRRPYTSPIV